MPKATRAGASNAAEGGHVRRLLRDGGLDVELSGPESDFYLGGDLTLRGEIKTGVLGAGTFEGIEREARCFPAGELMSPTASMNFGDGFPRLYCPPNERTDVYAVFEIEEWWLVKPDGTAGTIGVYFEWVNDHTQSDRQVRFDCSVRQVKIGTQGPLTSTSLLTRTGIDVPNVPANLSTTTVVGSVASGFPISLGDVGALANFYALKISRRGDDATNDTLDGPIGIVAASMTRGQ